jgi:uncharacterized protein YjbI with pentapeptide repeats
MNAILSRTSELVRTSSISEAQVSKRSRKIGPGADLLGARLSGQDPRAVDLLGADLRDSNLSGADFSSTFFLTQSQLKSARLKSGRLGDEVATIANSTSTLDFVEAKICSSEPGQLR